LPANYALKYVLPGRWKSISDMPADDKLNKLKEIISGYGSCLIAFSGGVDSTFLLKIVSQVLPSARLMAVTASSPTYPEEELLFSKRIASRLKVRHKIIRTDELKNRRFYSNTPRRCYFCKNELFSRLKKMAAKNKLKFIVDASNISDRDDFRPGEKAKAKLGVRSPLQEAGLTKEDIRSLSKKLGLVTWDKPSLACLASRVPYGTKINIELLRRIERGEKFIKGLGFRQVRIRDYGPLCRIEVPEDDLSKLIRRNRQIADQLRKLGYIYITVDLNGYYSGSMNAVIGR